MDQHRIRRLPGFVLVAVTFAVLPWIGDAVTAQSKTGTSNGRTYTITDVAGRKHTRIRKVTQAERKAAATRLKAKILKGTTDPTLAAQALAMAVLNAPSPVGSAEYLVGPNGQLIPDISGLVPNFANSPMPDMSGLDPNCGPPSYCGIRKFVDGLPGLGPGGANNLGQYIPIAIADTTSFPGADYYEIELGQYTEKMHTDLPPTTLRGYRQTNMGGQPFHYLGPLIVATKGRPVRIKFTNSLPTGAAGDLFIPVDTTVMGAGAGPRVSDATRMTTNGQLCAGGVDTDCYTQNRATLHLHGGVTPWISDGTTHQWITPAGEVTQYPEGVSVYNVPDMPNPGKPGSGTNPAGSGAQTFYYTNDQSARLMFYHDHAHGITRLNVYAGEAAGYLITDAAEQALLAGPLASVGVGIPLVIQDKTFVDARAIGYQDPTWTWGTGAPYTYTDATGKQTMLRQPNTGDLWWPHVYQPAQNPYDISGINAMGRWVYGPWFWPPTNNIAFKEVPNPYYDCDALGNPIPPATSCRDWQPVTTPGTPNPSITAEAFFDTPVVNGTAYPFLDVPAGAVRFRILNASHDRFWNLSLYVADAALPTEVQLNAAEVSAAKSDPFGTFPTPVAQPGPDWIYIGTEGGFLPKPVVVPAQPTTWVTDPTVFNAGNVDKHSLLLGPAERADVIVDFSAFAGKTLILYNDAPAAFPARDPRFDYYTDSADLMDTGGVASVQPGFGPNTRTVMQIRVGGSGTPFDLNALMTAFAPDAVTGTPGVFQSGQDPVVVGQTAYNTAYGTTFPARYPCWGIARIQDTSMCVQPVTGQAPLYLPLQPKAIHDEMGASFDDYGRMSTNLGLEQPFTQVGNQNFVLQSYSDPPTELIKLSDKAVPIGDARADGTQIWKITHNGVDTHPVHFHLFHVQLINRVGWDGAIRLPHPTELGWKDTVRISPLEDTIVALRPIAPTPGQLPSNWGELPNSIRPLEPALAPNSLLGFTNLDPQGNAVTVSNVMANFGWEYIWHCHILSHEEHDMMRAIAFAVPPRTPVLSGSITGTSNQRSVVLTWTSSLVATSFTVQKSADPTFGGVVTTFAAGARLTYTDKIGNILTPIFYRVFASNTVGGAVPGYPTMTRHSDYSNSFIANNVPSAAPANLTATMQGSAGVGSVKLTWTDAANNETSYVVERSNGSIVTLATLPANSTNYTDNTGLTAGTTYTYFVRAVNAVGAGTSQVTIATTAPNAPSNVTVTAVRSGGNAVVTVRWTDNSNNETAFKIQRSTDAAFSTFVEFTVNANVVTFSQTVSRGTNFYYRVLAENPFGSSAWMNASPFPILTP